MGYGSNASRDFWIRWIRNSFIREVKIWCVNYEINCYSILYLSHCYAVCSTVLYWTVLKQGPTVCNYFKFHWICWYWLQWIGTGSPLRMCLDTVIQDVRSILRNEFESGPLINHSFLFQIAVCRFCMKELISSYIRLSALTHWPLGDLTTLFN